MTENDLLAEQLDQIAGDFVERIRRGERPPVSEYQSRYPELAVDLGQLLPALALVEQAAQADDEQVRVDQIRSAPFMPIPTQIGDFQIAREVGRGGMGIVYEAYEQSLGRRVALKLLPEQTMLSPHSRERFECEARAAARLHHSGIVPVFGLGEHNGLHYIAMQFIDGCGLDEVISALGQSPGQDSDKTAANQSMAAIQIANSLRAGHQQNATLDQVSGAGVEIDRAQEDHQPALKDSLAETVTLRAEETDIGPLRTNPGEQVSIGPDAVLSSSNRNLWFSIARVGEQAARALNHAHCHGVLHRDVKPSNLLVDLNGQVWLADFGLARTDDQESLTRTGDILGTLRYMAPETFSGEMNVQSEVYALGLTLYEVVALRPAFDESNRNRLIQRVTSEPPERLKRLCPEAPRDLCTIIEKAIDPERSRRYESAADLADDLARFLNDEPIHARRVTVAERLIRWSRKNRAVAVSIATVLLTLLATSVGAGLAAVTFEEQAETEKTLRQEADDARHEMEIVMSDVSTTYGLLAVENRSSPPDENVAFDPDHDAAEALLWFASAGRYGDRDVRRRDASRIRISNWLHDVTVPVAAFDHESRLDQLSLDPSGDYLLTRSNGQMHVWNWREGRAATWIESPSAASRAVWSPGGQWLAVARAATGEEEPSTLEVINIQNGSVIHLESVDGSITSLAVSPDSTRLAIGTTSVRVLDCASWRFFKEELKHPAHVHSMRFSSHGMYLATAARDAKARVFTIPAPSSDDSLQSLDTKLVAGPLDHKPQVECPPVFVANGEGLITATSKSQLKWTPLGNGPKPKWDVLPTGDSMLLGLTTSHDGRWIAIGGYRDAQLWDTRRNAQTTLRLPHGNHVADMSFSPDGRFVLTAGWDARAKLWSLDQKRRVGQPLFHQGKVEHAAFSPDGKLVATAQVDGLARVWRLPAAQAEYDDHLLAVGYSSMRARTSADGRFAVTTRFDPFGWEFSARKCVVMDVSTGEQVGTPVDLAGSELRDAALSSRGKLLAIATRSKPKRFSLSVRKTTTSEPVGTSIALPADPQAIAFSPDDQKIAVYCGNGTSLLYSVADSAMLWEAKDDRLSGGMATRSVMFTSDGQNVVTTGPDFSAVRNTEDGSLRFEPIQTGGRLKAAISPDDSALALAAQGPGGLRVFDLQTGRPLSETMVHSDFVFELAFSRDSNLLLTAGRDGQAPLWNWRENRRVCPPLDHPDEVYDVGLTPDNEFALTACRDGYVRIWELTTGKLVASPYRIRGRMATSVAVTPDGRRAVLGMNGTAMISFDLAARLVPDGRPIDEVQRFSEIVSGQQIASGHSVRLTTDEWLQRWQAE